MATTQQHHHPGHRTVRVPGSDDHAGHHLITVTLRWTCLVCGGPRGEIRPVISYDGSRRLACDGWSNPCGHIDTYAAARREAASRASGAGAQQVPPSDRT
jgi:hypothetical protein